LVVDFLFAAFGRHFERERREKRRMAVGRKGKMKAHYLSFFPFFRNSTQFRRVFERWTQWQPGHEVWRSYVNFEDRVASAAASAAAASAKGAARFSSSGDPTLTRAVYERYVRALPTVDAYVAWAKWEMR
jgi:hypothetical protein